MADYNILTPDNLNDLIYSPFSIAIGEQEHKRLQKQINNYNYYKGLQHRGASDELVAASELTRPPGLDYDPTRYTTNYFKSIIKRKARWQMAGAHSVNVVPKQIDDRTAAATAGYEASAAQLREYDRAEKFEKLLNTLWIENNMRTQLIQAARDRLIAGRVAAKIAYNTRTGKLKWIFHPDTETFPIFSDDGFNDLLACHFVTEKEDQDGNVIYRKQTFELDGDQCYLSEGEYDEELNLIREITPRGSMGINFIPVVLFPITDLTGEPSVNYEVDDIRELTDRLNQLNEDAIDSLKFEMFGITAVVNATPGTAAAMQIAPGAVVEITNAGDQQADLKRIEGSFRWKEAFNSQYDRIKQALHEITSVPTVNTGELNFGGMNSYALHIVFHEIINETAEHWHAWKTGLKELHEKSIKYLQARANDRAFSYDKTALAAIGDDLAHDINFMLPLPDSRSELIELLSMEIAAGLESQTGALARAGVENTAAKKAEIEAERAASLRSGDPYQDL